MISPQLMARSIGLIKYDGNNWERINTSSSGYPSTTASKIILDQEDNKWIAAGWNGTVKFDDENWTIYNTSNSEIPHNGITDLVIDPEGNK